MLPKNWATTTYVVSSCHICSQLITRLYPRVLSEMQQQRLGIIWLHCYERCTVGLLFHPRNEGKISRMCSTSHPLKRRNSSNRNPREKRWRRFLDLAYRLSRSREHYNSIRPTSPSRSTCAKFDRSSIAHNIRGWNPVYHELWNNCKRQNLLPIVYNFISKWGQIPSKC